MAATFGGRLTFMLGLLGSALGAAGCGPEEADFAEVCEEAVRATLVCTHQGEEPLPIEVKVASERRCDPQQFACAEPWKDLMSCELETDSCYYNSWIGPLSLRQAEESCQDLYASFDACALRQHEADVAAGKSVSYTNWIPTE